MSTNVAIVPYSERYSEAHRVFALKMWPEKRRRREERYIRWKFRGPTQGEVQGLLLAIENDAVVGELGLIPVEICIGDQISQAQWVCEFMVDPAVRGKWIGSKLLKAAITRNMVSLGSNPSKAADVVITRVGFREINGPKAMLLPVKLNHVLSWKIPEKIKFLIPLLAQLGRPVIAWRSRALKRVKQVNPANRVSWEEVVPLIEQRQKLLTFPYVVHDRAFLQWRCNGLEGFAAKIYIMATNAGGYAIVEEGGPYLYVHDWFAPNNEDFIGLFQEIFRIAIQERSQTIQALSQDNLETNMLLGVGFMVRPHNVKIMCYPPARLIPAWDRFSYCWYDSDGNL